jgi:outer membrane lipoprotein-sorting protein
MLETFFALAIISAPNAIDIATKALDNNTFSTSNARAELTLQVSKNGTVMRTRQLVTMIRRDPSTVRSFVEFMGPADVAGTKFLSVEKRGETAEQYIFLPAFKKVKRVAGSQRSSSFMGTDFSYADLDGREASESDWKSLPDEKVGGQDCFVIEGTAKKADDDYGRTVMWVHKEHFLPMRIDYFDKNKTTLMKRLSAQKIKKIDDRWIVSVSTMQSMEEGTQTKLDASNIDFKTAISDDQFSQRALER